MKLWTIGTAARELGTTDATVRGLVRAWRIRTLPVPHSGMAKGLDESHMRTLARALGMDWPVPPAPKGRRKAARARG